jgi:hypothetical protein
MTNSVTVSAAGTALVGANIAVSGVITPATNTVFLALSMQNATLPNVLFTAVTPGSGGAYSGTLVAAAPGTYYVWAWDQVTGVSAVSGAILVAATLAGLLQGIPLTTAQAQALFGMTGSGLTPDQLPAAAAAGPTDNLIVQQAASPKTLLTQPLSAFWTWIQTQLPGYLLPQVNVAANINLTNSAHNGRFLLVTATGVTITALLASLGPGFECTLFNNSGGVVTVSGITLSGGGTTIANGARVLLTGWNIGGTLTIYGDPL